MTPVFWLSLGGLFVSIALITGVGLQLVLFGRTSTQRRLREIAPVTGGSSLIVDPIRLTERVDPRLERIAKKIPKSPKEMSVLRRRLAPTGAGSVTDNLLARRRSLRRVRAAVARVGD